MSWEKGRDFSRTKKEKNKSLTFLVIDQHDTQKDIPPLLCFFVIANEKYRVFCSSEKFQWNKKSEQALIYNTIIGIDKF